MSKKRKKGFAPVRPILALPTTPSDSSLDSSRQKTSATPEPTAKTRSTFLVKLAIPVIILVGLVVFFDGLKNPFVYDDFGQIVNNPVVHSLGHLDSLFKGGTLYNGNGFGPLSGVYFRPIMMSLFALIYTIFGSQSLYFHLVQLALGIGSSVLIYLIFKYSFKPYLSLFLALVFLIHPIDSQVIFGIEAAQDTLFLFFGLLAIWLLLRFSSKRSLWLVVLALVLSLLSKETGILFLAMSLLYLFWFDLQRLKPFFLMMSVPFAVYLILKIHAVGLLSKPTLAPIDKLGFLARLMTMPEILLFYISKFIFPSSLATGYYWSHSSFSVNHVLIPLLVDAAVIISFIYAGRLVHQKLPGPMYLTFRFFAVWTVIGLLANLQILPLDDTVNEAWFYFPIVGVLGMLGVLFTSTFWRIPRPWQLMTAIVLIGILCVRTIYRGRDWNSQLTLSYADLKASPQDYAAADSISTELMDQGNLTQAQKYALLSIKLYPQSANYVTLGSIDAQMGLFENAQSYFYQGLKFPKSYIVADDISRLTMFTGTPDNNINTLHLMINNFPSDANPWLYLALIEYTKLNDQATAKSAIQNAAKLGQSGLISQAYSAIMNDEPLPPDLIAKQ